MTKGANAQDVKYVFLETILPRNNQKCDVVAGLLKGIVEKDGEILILMNGIGDATNCVNLSYYGIMYIQTMTKDYKNHKCFNSEEEDQKDALKVLKELHTGLIEAGFGYKGDKNVIDIEKYTEVPKEYLETNAFNDPATSTRTATYRESSITRYHADSGASFYKKAEPKPEPEPAAIVRTKTKKPAKDIIELMATKLDQIAAGEYEPNIPKLAEDDPPPPTAGVDDDDYDWESAIH